MKAWALPTFAHPNIFHFRKALSGSSGHGVKIRLHMGGESDMWGARGYLITVICVGLAGAAYGAWPHRALKDSGDHRMKKILVKCGPPAEDLVNGTYVLVGSQNGSLIAQVSEYRKGLLKKRTFDVQQTRCPCPKAFAGKRLKLQISDLSMSWLTQGPAKSNYLATLEYKTKLSPKRKTLGLACNIL